MHHQINEKYSLKMNRKFYHFFGHILKTSSKIFSESKHMTKMNKHLAIHYASEWTYLKALRALKWAIPTINLIRYNNLGMSNIQIKKEI